MFRLSRRASGPLLHAQFPRGILRMSAVPWTHVSESAVVLDGIWKSSSDDRQYRSLTLPNGLRALLISDPAADSAAAAMSVAVGHTSDPWEISGLSHFLEHMLFLGTTKYPDEASYKRFLKDRGGGSNASTSGAE